ncbi:hypothetical protein KUCAC02_016604 [Chaenocephalus aceratus]|nr:hypothetical protein KUCAC02_016604 [Chaenocephalus aceratus]
MWIKLFFLLFLSYKKLKTILESRGLPYSGLAEKKDVSELVEKSGELTHGELYSAMKKEKEQTEAGRQHHLQWRDALL